MEFKLELCKEKYHKGYVDCFTLKKHERWASDRNNSKIYYWTKSGKWLDLWALDLLPEIYYYETLEGLLQSLVSSNIRKRIIIMLARHSIDIEQLRKNSWREI